MGVKRRFLGIVIADDGDRSQDTDNGNHYDEFDYGKAFGSVVLFSVHWY